LLTIEERELELGLFLVDGENQTASASGQLFVIGEFVDLFLFEVADDFLCHFGVSQQSLFGVFLSVERAGVGISQFSDHTAIADVDLFVSSFEELHVLLEFEVVTFSADEHFVFVFLLLLGLFVVVGGDVSDEFFLLWFFGRGFLVFGLVDVDHSWFFFCFFYFFCVFDSLDDFFRFIV